jgi:hypothetical protein
MSMNNRNYKMSSSNVSTEVSELRKLYEAIQEFRESMERDLPLNDFVRVCLENYMALLHITYIEWKRRNYPPSAYKQAA